MSTTSTTSGGFGNVATRTPAAGRWQWVGTANGCEARHLTDDPDLYLTAEPLSSPRLRGVALIDEVGRVYATRFELTHFAPLVSGVSASGADIRELAQRVVGVAHHDATYPRAVTAPPSAGLRRALAAALREVAEAAPGPDYLIHADDLGMLATEIATGGAPAVEVPDGSWDAAAAAPGFNEHDWVPAVRRRRAEGRGAAVSAVEIPDGVDVHTEPDDGQTGEAGS